MFIPTVLPLYFRTKKIEGRTKIMFKSQFVPANVITHCVDISFKIRTLHVNKVTKPKFDLDHFLLKQF